jgi:hypothetical protein
MITAFPQVRGGFRSALTLVTSPRNVLPVQPTGRQRSGRESEAPKGNRPVPVNSASRYRQPPSLDSPNRPPVDREGERKRHLTSGFGHRTTRLDASDITGYSWGATQHDTQHRRRKRDKRDTADAYSALSPEPDHDR